MKIVSIEPTPSPNTMKLNMDESIPSGVKYNFTKEDYEGAPLYIQKLLSIDGVKSVYQVADFIAVDRHPKGDWEYILSKARSILGEVESGNTADPVQKTISAQEHYGEVQVFVQMFRGIPIQVKLEIGDQQVRFGLPERFMKAAMKVQHLSENIVFERKWVEQGVRYGELQEIGETVVQEISAAYDEKRLEELVDAALHHISLDEKAESVTVTEEMLDEEDWRRRYAVLERMNPTEEDIPVLRKALDDDNQSVRRLATVYLGMIGGKKVLPLLFKALKDPSVSVRRTAGDTLSDLGDPDAIGPMTEALKDPNKLVRWRAARFLYEVGDVTAIPALKEAQNDPEFEVRMQIRIALERIESGEEASGTVWQQMTRAISDESKSN